MITAILRNASFVAWLSLIVGILPLCIGVAYAIRPTEQRLALMRPLSLAAIFSALASLSIGAIVILDGLSTTGTPNWRMVALGAAETFVPVFSSFA